MMHSLTHFFTPELSHTQNGKSSLDQVKSLLQGFIYYQLSVAVFLYLLHSNMWNIHCKLDYTESSFYSFKFAGFG